MAAIWNELMPNSAAESTEFHTGLLGISSPKVPGPIDYTMLNVGGEDLAEVMQITDDMGPVPPHRAVYFGVDDVDDTVAKVESQVAPWRFRWPTPQESTVSPD